MITLADALAHQRPCPCDCHRTLAPEARSLGVAALYRLDDALRGWGYQPLYDLHGDALFRQAQRQNDRTTRKLAVRFGECVYRRLLGSMLHEVLHAVFGEAGETNHGIPFGLPYSVPSEVAPRDEESYLRPFNFGEARAWVGVWLLGKKMFGVSWDVRTARDIGTYCFTSGNALVPAPAGFRPVAHLDRTHHAERYYARGRALEADARAWFTPENMAVVVARVNEAAALGEKRRPRVFQDPTLVASLSPGKIGRNDPCICGTDKKYKACCGQRSEPHFEPTLLAR